LSTTPVNSAALLFGEELYGAGGKPPFHTKTENRENRVQNRLLQVHKKNYLATLTLNRPEKKNSLSPELVKALLQTLAELSADDTIRTVVIRGAGDKAFCAGYDIGSLPTGGSDDPDEALKRLNSVESLFQTLRDYPFPVIAMINGVAFGAGCELAICCDIRIGADNIRIGMPPAKLGLVYPWNGLQRFIQVIGLKSTKEIFFTGRAYEGIRLKEIGLVDYLIPARKLESFTRRMAQDIAANSPLSLKGTKRVLNLLLRASQFDKNDLIEAESITQASFLSEDLKEGQKAFLEKRKPLFKGR
jgi:enoyl-CoA hydratase/carnithine racemase